MKRFKKISTSIAIMAICSSSLTNISALPSGPDSNIALKKALRVPRQTLPRVINKPKAKTSYFSKKNLLIAGGIASTATLGVFAYNYGKGISTEFTRLGTENKDSYRITNAYKALGHGVSTASADLITKFSGFWSLVVGDGKKLETSGNQETPGTTQTKILENPAGTSKINQSQSTSTDAQKGELTNSDGKKDSVSSATPTEESDFLQTVIWGGLI